MDAATLFWGGRQPEYSLPDADVSGSCSSSFLSWQVAKLHSREAAGD